MIKAVLDNIEEVDESLRGLYVENNGKYTLDLDPDSTKSHPNVDKLMKALHSERTTARDSTKQLDEFKRQYEGVDLKEIRAILHERDELKKQKMIEKGEYQKLLDEQENKLRLDYENQIRESSTQIDHKTKQLNSYVLKAQATQALAAAGVIPEAYEDALNRANNVWSVDSDLKLIARDRNGSILTDGVTPLTIEEWAKSLPSHFFTKPSGGGGVNPNSGSPGSGKFVDSKEYKSMSGASKMRYLAEHGM